MMSYDYHKFVHPVPAGFTIPEGTQVRRVDSAPREAESFFIMPYDLQVGTSNRTTYYLDYDITRPALPKKTSSVIDNVRVGMDEYPVAVYQGSQVWSAFNNDGDRKGVFSTEIESFGTTPSTKEED